MATQLKDSASIEQIIKEMTLEEKVSCMTGGSPFHTRAMEKYGIPGILLMDGGTGINSQQICYEQVFQSYVNELEARGEQLDESACDSMGGIGVCVNDERLMGEFIRAYTGCRQNPGPLGCYPPGMTLGATWNPEVIAQCGHALAKEVNAAGVDILLGTPNVNISRDPLNGRLFEGYSEDPCLVSKLAPAFACSVQDEGVIANVKHFAANNQETDRMGINEVIPERALREIYLPGFKAVTDAGCKTIMSAYNRINGVPCAQNRWLLHDVLRDEWGFEGMVMSDWFAAYDQVEACAAGNDLIMPGPRNPQPVLDALAEGKLAEEAVDECVRHILSLVLETITFKGGRLDDYDIQEGIEAAYHAAVEAATLLKNDGVLPIAKDARPAIYGKYSRNLIASGGGSADVITTLNTNILDCASESFGADHVSFDEVTADTTVVIVTVGSKGQEGADRTGMRMDDDDRKTLDTAIRAAKERNIPVVVVMNIAGPIEIGDWEEQVSAILNIYLPGMQGGRAALDVLTGKVNPSGKLPLTFPKRYRDCPTYGNFPGYNREVFYGEGIYVGYRYYEKKGIEVMYPFGYGLSYTTFDITSAQAPERVNVEEDDVPVCVRVKNTGRTAGAEVVQLYVGDVVSTLDKPVKELKAFQKVFLEPGEEKEITFVLTKSDFAGYDTKVGDWTTEPGEYRLYIGNSSADISRVLTLQVECENPYGLGPNVDISIIASNTAAAEVVKSVTGLDLLQAASNYLVFDPFAPFFKVWRDTLAPALNADREGSDALLEEIYEGWKRI